MGSGPPGPRGGNSQTRRRVDESLADHTDRDIADVEASTQRDTFTSAKEALVYGMIDRIMERTPQRIRASIRSREAR